MCVFSYDNNFIFFHIPKCAGTSINTLLKEHLSNEEYIKHTHIRYLESKKLFENNGKLDWFINSKKFTIIRHPITRTISLYKYIVTHSDHYLHDIAKSLSFYGFCKHLKKVKDDNITSCYTHLKNENGIIPNDISIFKVEEIDFVSDEISKIVGVYIEKIPLINTSELEIQLKNNEILDCKNIIEEIFEEDYNFYKNNETAININTYITSKIN
jgi:hypothetical protein